MFTGPPVGEGKLDQAQAGDAYGRMLTQVTAMVNRITTGPAGLQGQANGQAGRGRMGGRWPQQ